MQQTEALSILKTGANVFLTGEPGAGKTHTINEYVAYLRRYGIEPAITASTGIAATHIGGLTIHSWSGIGIKNRLSEYELDKLASSEYLVKRISKAHVLIIDEVSMLSAQTLGMVDAVCRATRRRKEPFGGLQVIFVGDFFQLPPIVRMNEEVRDEYNQEVTEHAHTGRFACDAPAWKAAKPIVCYLTEQHRQDDADFLNLLSAVRQNTFTEKHLQHIEKRKIAEHEAPDAIPKLFSHNSNVDRVNDHTLSKIAGITKIFEMTARGPAHLIETLKRGCLSPEKLTLKIGAAVMFTKNNPREGFVNGTLGTVKDFSATSSYPIVKTRDGKTIEVAPMDWVVEEGGVIRARITQLPLRLAWAITVHKSQGMSLDAAIMDLSAVFEYGQGYVALSRVRRLSGLHMLGWNARAFEVHPEILAKDETFRQSSEEARSAFAKVTPKDLAKMHEQFITACGGSLKKGEEKKKLKERKAKQNVGGKKPKGATYEETHALLKEGKTISAIADVRGLAPTTIVGHIEKLFIEGRLEKDEIEKLLPEHLSAGWGDIQQAFKKHPGEKLIPVFEALKGKYSFEDLRLVRMLL
jgi:hypothetical protein